MQRIIELTDSASVEQHLNHNPRVLSYRDSALWPGIIEVTVDGRIPIPAAVAVEARQLDLDWVLSDRPRT